MAADPAPPRSTTSDVIFAPVRTANAFERTVERIGTAIKMGLLRPGERLPAERDLAVRLGLSRSTVREALRLLVEAGYLESRRGRTGGTFVTANAPVLLAAHEIVTPGAAPGVPGTLRFRRVVELGAAELAAERATPADLADLEDLIREADSHDAAHYAEYRAADGRLHVRIAAIADSAQLLEAMSSVQATLTGVLLGIPRSDDSLVNSTRQHTRLLAAIATRDAHGARAVMREHVEGIERLIAGLLPG